MDVWVLSTIGYDYQDVEILGVYVDPERAKADAEKHFQAEHRAFFETEGGRWRLIDGVWRQASFPKKYDAYHGYDLRKYEVKE